MEIGPQVVMWPTVDICRIDGGRSWISVSTLLEGLLSMFVALMVGALGSPSAPPKGPAVDVF
jgi:hypothetical protein